MKWMRPEFVEIDMSAEIGGYQRDNEGPADDLPGEPRHGSSQLGADQGDGATA